MTRRLFKAGLIGSILLGLVSVGLKDKSASEEYPRNRIEDEKIEKRIDEIFVQRSESLNKAIMNPRSGAREHFLKKGFEEYVNSDGSPIQYTFNIDGRVHYVEPFVVYNAAPCGFGINYGIITSKKDDTRPIMYFIYPKSFGVFSMAVETFKSIRLEKFCYFPGEPESEEIFGKAQSQVDRYKDLMDKEVQKRKEETAQRWSQEKQRRLEEDLKLLD